MQTGANVDLKLASIVIFGRMYLMLLKKWSVMKPPQSSSGVIPEGFEGGAKICLLQILLGGLPENHMRTVTTAVNEWKLYGSWHLLSLPHCLSTPRQYITHNATWSRQFGQRLRCVSLAAVNVFCSRDEEQLQRSGRLTSF